jgi:hypothetical protein
MAQPVVIQDTISIAAGATNDNVIASNSSLRQLLRAPFFGAGKLGAVISATGLRINFNHGSRNVVADSDLRVGTDLQDPYDFLANNWFTEPGDILALRAANPTGGAISLRYRIQIDPPPPGWNGVLPPETRVMQRLNSIAANAIDTEVTDGLVYSRPARDSMMKILATASAAGLTHRVNMEMDSILPPSAVAPLNRIPQEPLDSIVDGIEAPHDKLAQILVSNSTGGALTYFWRMLLEELSR